VRRRFDHILVDEYQDTNALQAQILLRLRPDGEGVTVVGDDAQSIYSSRAATVRNILDFPKQFTPPARREARGELPLDSTDTGGVQRDDRAGDRGLPQTTRFKQTIGRAPAACRSGR
jgi:UvrD/REP helicase N-terminal domain